MNKNIKLLVEGLFDDDIFNDDNIETQVDLSEKIDILDKKQLFKLLQDTAKKLEYKDTILNIIELFFPYDRWSLIEAASLIEPLYINLLEFSLHWETVTGLTKLFDLFLINNIRIHVDYLVLQLENTNKSIVNITDIIDFRKYDKILTVKCFTVSYGIIKNLIGMPTNVTDEICFHWINKIENMEGIPLNNLYKFEFTESVFPDDWTGFPSEIVSIVHTNRKLDEVVSKYYNLKITQYDEFIELFKTIYGLFKNFPNKLTFNTNRPEYIGCAIIYDNWRSDTLKIFKSYLSDCFKALHYKNIPTLKKQLTGPMKYVKN